MLALLVILALFGGLRSVRLLRQWWRLLPRRNADFGLE